MKQLKYLMVMILSAFFLNITYTAMACSCHIGKEYKNIVGKITEINKENNAIRVKANRGDSVEEFFLPVNVIDSLMVGDEVRVSFGAMGKTPISIKKMTQVVATQNFTHR